MSNPPLSLALSEVIGKLHDVKISIAECSQHVDFDSDDSAQFALWHGDMAFIERLIGDFMYEHGLNTEKTPAIRHNRQPYPRNRKVVIVDDKIFNESWVGAERKPT